MYRRNTMEMRLQAIQGKGPWAQGGKISNRLVTVTLVWPRPLMASRVVAQTHSFTRDGLDVSGKDWSERILFKETVEGPCGVIVQVSESMTAQQLTRAAAAVGEAVLRAAGSAAASIAVGPGMTALARFPFSFLAGEISGLGKTAKVVAAGRITLVPGEHASVMEVPLQVPEDVVQLRRSTRGGRVQTRRETLHKAGDAAGTALLEVDYYR
jgi:hypothetical protein